MMKIFPTILLMHIFILDAVFGDPSGVEISRVIIHSFTQAQILDAERKTDSPDKLARALLQLLFSGQELVY